MAESDSGVDTGNESNQSNSMSLGSSPLSDEDKDADSNNCSQNYFHQNLCLYVDIDFKEYRQDQINRKIKCRKTTYQNRRERTMSSFQQHVAERKLRDAAHKNDISTVRNLLDHEVNPNAVDFKRRSALHFAAASGYTDIAKLLLERGANPNQQDLVGNTPLHLAACTTKIEMVTLLLKAGTNVNALDCNGRSPFHLAESKLKLLQMNKEYSSAQLKAEVVHVLEMMQVYLQRSGRSGEDLINAFSNRLHHHQTREEVDNDVSDLLSSLSHLSLQAS